MEEYVYAEPANETAHRHEIPTVVGELIAADRLQVQVFSSPEQWVGITNPEDFEHAQRALADRYRY